MNTSKILLLVASAVILLMAISLHDKVHGLKNAVDEANVKVKIQLRDEYVRGFLDGACQQEVYRFKNHNTNGTPVIQLERVLEECQKAYDMTHGKSSTNKMETVTVTK